MTRNSTLISILIAQAVAVMAAEAPGSPEQREQFLRTAEIVSRKGLSMGVTNSQKALLDDNGRQHHAHIQTIDISKAQFQTNAGTELNFRDCYKYNIAAYELAKLLNLDMVPTSVARKVAGQSAAVTWWVDDVLMTGLDRYNKKMEPPNPSDWNRQMAVVTVFDQLIYNTDRNLGNLIIDKDWRVWMIDHTRAFRMHKVCSNLKALRQCDRKLLASIRELSPAAVREHLGPYLTKSEIEGLMARRDQIVKHFDEEVGSRSESAVLYDQVAR